MCDLKIDSVIFMIIVWEIILASIGFSLYTLLKKNNKK